MGLKSLLLLVVAALGLTLGAMWWFGGPSGGVAVAEAAGEPVPLKRSAETAADAPTRAPAPSSRELDRLTRAEELLTSGRLDEAAALARELRAAPDGGVRARAAFVLSFATEDRLERRRLLSEALAAGAVHGPEFESVRAVLDDLNIRPGASLLPALDTASYVVQPGDSLWRLCNKVFPERFGVYHEVGLVQLVNGHSSSNLRPGDTLEIPLEPLRIVVFSDDHGLVCLLGDVALSAFHVGLGRESRTPVGDFTIEVKQENPDWYHNGNVIPFGDPANVLGTRWMGFANRPGATGFGIHGTAHPESIGFDESMGCIRMRNEEVEVLFEYVARGTVVSILG